MKEGGYFESARNIFILKAVKKSENETELEYFAMKL